LAVLGREFPLGLVRCVTLKQDDELERMLARLQVGEFIFEQPATGDIEYIFKHSVTQEVAYNSLLLERRKLLHERAGVALESMFSGQLEDHLEELAHHYSRSDNIGKAVEYLKRAGKQAVARSAMVEAERHYVRALVLLSGLPEDVERDHRELELQRALGPALMAVKGYAAPEVERAYTRTRELCERLDDPREFFAAIYGLWVRHLVRGELRKAYELAEQLLQRAQRLFAAQLQPKRFSRTPLLLST
jgi:predicted ATPase